MNTRSTTITARPPEGPYRKWSSLALGATANFLQRCCRFCFRLVMLSVLIAACGDSTKTEAPERAAGEAWWVLEVPGFILVYGGRHPTGTGWTLEYSNGPATLQITAFEKPNAATDRILRDSPVVGEATLEELKLTLRRWKGIPEDEIPPSVGADWTDGGVLMLFGSAKDELELRAYLKGLRKVDRNQWDAEVAKTPTPPPPVPSSMIVPSSTATSR